MKDAIALAAGLSAAVAAYFLMEWMQDAAPRSADALFIALMVYAVWHFWPRRKRAS